jgi:hypothetical protein
MIPCFFPNICLFSPTFGLPSLKPIFLVYIIYRAGTRRGVSSLPPCARRFLPQASISNFLPLLIQKPKKLLQIQGHTLCWTIYVTKFGGKEGLPFISAAKNSHLYLLGLSQNCYCCWLIWHLAGGRWTNNFPSPFCCPPMMWQG